MMADEEDMIKIESSYDDDDTEDEEEVIESSQLPVDPNAIKKRMEMSVILNTGYDRLPCLSGSVSLFA